MNYCNCPDCRTKNCPESATAERWGLIAEVENPYYDNALKEHKEWAVLKARYEEQKMNNQIEAEKELLQKLKAKYETQPYNDKSSHGVAVG
jgi:hypothetical protein